MSAWHDRVGDLILFEALTGGALDVKTGNIAGNLTKIFQKSQMPGGLPGGGGMGGFGIDRYIKFTRLLQNHKFNVLDSAHRFFDLPRTAVLTIFKDPRAVNRDARKINQRDERLHESLQGRASGNLSSRRFISLARAPIN